MGSISLDNSGTKLVSKTLQLEKKVVIMAKLFQWITLIQSLLLMYQSKITQVKKGLMKKQTSTMAHRNANWNWFAKAVSDDYKLWKGMVEQYKTL